MRNVRGLGSWAWVVEEAERDAQSGQVGAAAQVARMGANGGRMQAMRCYAIFSEQAAHREPGRSIYAGSSGGTSHILILAVDATDARDPGQADAGRIHGSGEERG